MTTASVVPSLVDLALLRLTLSHIESKHFKVAPQIPLEVLLVLSANQGSLRLSELYRRVRATQAAVRLHLRSLEMLELVDEGIDPLDRRARRIFLTPKGEANVRRYAEDSMRVMAQLGPEKAMHDA
jgi:DNA-binding MarR family transcriptional regulator